MSDVLFKASLQNTLEPEVGRFNNVNNKEGTFTLEDGEYYLTNNDTDTSYRVYYPTKDITYSVGFTTIEFDVNYNHSYSSLIQPCLLFNSDDNKSWYAFGVADSSLWFGDGPNFPNYEIVASPSTWLHVKCIFDYNPGQSIVHIYIDNVEVINFTVSKNYDIKTIDILGNNDDLVHLVPDAKIKNITISNSKKHYLDTVGLTSLWSKIKALFATKTELASKVNTSELSPVAKSGDYNDLSNKPVLPQINVDATDGSWVISRDTDGNFFRMIHTGWSNPPQNYWAGMYFQTSDNLPIFSFAARQTSSSLPNKENFTVGNNGYIRGYDTEGNKAVTLTINGGTAGKPETQNITIGGTFVTDGNQRPFSANKYTIGTSDMPYEAMYAGTFNTDSRSSTSGLIASNSSTMHSLMLGIGGTGVNRGIYDIKNKRWSVLLDNTDYIMTQCPTPPEGDSSNKLATTEWVQNELAKLRQALHDIQEPENPEEPKEPEEP